MPHRTHAPLTHTSYGWSRRDTSRATRQQQQWNACCSSRTSRRTTSRCAARTWASASPSTSRAQMLSLRRWRPARLLRCAETTGATGVAASPTPRATRSPCLCIRTTAWRTARRAETRSTGEIVEQVGMVDLTCRPRDGLVSLGWFPLATIAYDPDIRRATTTLHWDNIIDGGFNPTAIQELLDPRPRRRAHRPDAPTEAPTLRHLRHAHRETPRRRPTMAPPPQHQRTCSPLRPKRRTHPDRGHSPPHITLLRNCDAGARRLAHCRRADTPLRPRRR